MTDPYRAPPAGWKPEPREGSSFLKREVPSGIGRVAIIGTTSGAPAWTEEQLAEWLTNSGAYRGDVAAEVAKRIFNPQPTMVVRIESKDPA